MIFTIVLANLYKGINGNDVFSYSKILNNLYLFIVCIKFYYNFAFIITKNHKFN